MEGSDAFGSADSGPTTTSEATDSAASGAPGVSPPDAGTTSTPDLTEQEQALAAKLGVPIADQVASAVREQLGQQGQPEPTEPGPDDWISALLDEADPADEDPEAEPQTPSEPQQQQAPGFAADDPILQHPAVQTLAQQNAQLAEGLETMRDYLIGREEQEERSALENFAEANPAIRRPEVASAVKAKVDALAERAGDPTLRTDPSFVSAAYHEVMAGMAASARAEQGAQPQRPGVPPETGAGASVDGRVSEQDQFWGEIKQAGGTAFPT